MRWGLWCFCCACGRVGFNPVGDASTVDAAFSAPVTLDVLNSAASDDDLSMTSDSLELYFASARTGTEQVYVSTRATKNDEWTPPIPVAELNQGGDINNPRVTSDGLSIYFAAMRGGTQGTDLFHATRVDRASPWSAPVRLTEIANAANDYEPWVSEGELAIYFIRNVSGGGSEPYVATRASKTDPFGAAVRIDSLDSPSPSVYDGGPWVAAGDLFALFHSSRGGLGLTDIFMATRGSAAAPFDVPVLFGDVNSAAHDEDPWLSPDGHVFLFSSDRNGSFDLFMSTR